MSAGGGRRWSHRSQALPEQGDGGGSAVVDEALSHCFQLRLSLPSVLLGPCHGSKQRQAPAGEREGGG